MVNLRRRDFITLLGGAAARGTRTAERSAPGRGIRPRSHPSGRDGRIKSHFPACTGLCPRFARPRLDRGSGRRH
jgi:hypothetical protein